MAVGKCSDEDDIDQKLVTIAIGGIQLFPIRADAAQLAAVVEHMSGTEVHIVVDLGIAGGLFTVYGCDLTDGYIRINADYTT